MDHAGRRTILPVILAAVPAAFLALRSEPGASAATGEPIGVGEHLSKTLMGGSLAMQTSDLATQRGTHPRVKQFAAIESAEQMTIAQVLTNTPTPRPVELDARHAAVLQRLAAMQPGPGFDAAYVQAQIEGHQELFEIQNGFLNTLGTMTTDQAHIAMLARTTIQSHLTLLRDLAQILRA